MDKNASFLTLRAWPGRCDEVRRVTLQHAKAGTAREAA